MYIDLEYLDTCELSPARLTLVYCSWSLDVHNFCLCLDYTTFPKFVMDGDDSLLVNLANSLTLKTEVHYHLLSALLTLYTLVVLVVLSKTLQK